MGKGPIELLNELNRENRRKTLNQRINYKGNYENYITGGSSALDGQASLRDTNAYANVLADATNPSSRDEWTRELNDRYTNPQHNEIAGNSPVGSGRRYIHRYTPSTRRGRRASDIWFRAGINGTPPEKRQTFEQIQALMRKYEGGGK